MYRMDSVRGYPKLIGRIAELGLRQADLAAYLGVHPTLLNAILRGRREAPTGFEARVEAALERHEAAERAADEARERVLAEPEARTE